MNATAPVEIPIANRPPAALVEMYIALRDAKKKADDEYKKSMERTNQGLEKLENILLSKLIELDCESLSCKSGTVYRNVQNSATVKEKDEFREWLIKTGKWEAADLRASKVVIREMLENGEVVPGVNFSSIQTVGVRRS